MTRLRQFFHLLWLLGAILAITGCTYEAAVQRLAPAEQVEFRVYRKSMSAAQTRTYLAKATAEERAAYAREIGLAQRFQALTPQDRETVLAGYPREGMSLEALRFLWGEPYSQEGHAPHYGHWFYLGSSFSLAGNGNQRWNFGTRVDVYFVDGRVVGWVNFSPTIDESGSDCNGC